MCSTYRAGRPCSLIAPRAVSHVFSGSSWLSELCPQSQQSGWQPHSFWQVLAWVSRTTEKCSMFTAGAAVKCCNSYMLCNLLDFVGFGENCIFFFSFLTILKCVTYTCNKQTLVKSVWKFCHCLHIWSERVSWIVNESEPLKRGKRAKRALGTVLLLVLIYKRFNMVFLRSLLARVVTALVFCSFVFRLS